MKKILFIAHHRMDRAPGQRYRFEQYFNFLSEHGIKCELANIIDEKDDAILYASGNYFQKFLIALKGYKVRWGNLKKIHDYDLVIIFREAILTRSIFFEKRIAKSGVPIIFDFDDAIWIKDVSSGNRFLSFLKNANKIDKILPLCSHVTAGNHYLAEYAKKFNKNVSIFPSTIDTEKYKPLKNKNTSIVLGWVGSHTTIKHFELIESVFITLKAKYQDRIDFKVIGDPLYSNDELGVKGMAWSNEMEVNSFNSIDIGIMPLPETPWAKGKCAMKALLYMSVGKPAVMSAVGMNLDVVEHGVNGFVPTDEQQWLAILSQLIESKEQREQVGLKGRETVVQKYSFDAQKNKYLTLYTSLMKAVPSVDKPV